MGIKPRGAPLPVTEVVLDAFEAIYFWRPEDTSDLKIGAHLAVPACARLGVPVPDLAWPVDLAVFVDALGGSTAPTSTAADPDRLPETCSGGGPVLAIPAELAARWRGTDGSGQTDYDRACEPRDPRPTEYGGVGWVPVGDGAALALDLELMTTALVIGGDLVIARNYPSEPRRTELEALVAETSDGAWAPFPRALHLGDGRLFLFDAAFPGAADPGAIESDDGVVVIEAAPGNYAVDVASIDGVDLIRLRPR